jgi:hypothetical protein
VRASSVIENLNSRLRSYFFLRRHLGREHLALLQFFLGLRQNPWVKKAGALPQTPGFSRHGSGVQRCG